MGASPENPCKDVHGCDGCDPLGRTAKPLVLFLLISKCWQHLPHRSNSTEICWSPHGDPQEDGIGPYPLSSQLSVIFRGREKKGGDFTQESHLGICDQPGLATEPCFHRFTDERLMDLSQVPQVVKKELGLSWVCSVSPHQPPTCRDKRSAFSHLHLYINLNQLSCVSWGTLIFRLRLLKWNTRCWPG